MNTVKSKAGVSVLYIRWLKGFNLVWILQKWWRLEFFVVIRPELTSCILRRLLLHLYWSQTCLCVVSVYRASGGNEVTNTTNDRGVISRKVSLNWTRLSGEMPSGSDAGELSISSQTWNDYDSCFNLKSWSSPNFVAALGRPPGIDWDDNK